MKRAFTFLILILCLSAFMLISCEKSYSITYELDGGENNPGNPNTYDVDDIINLGFAKKDGYMFAGWYIDSNFTVSVTEINCGEGDITLYAKWIPCEEIFNFDKEADGYTVTIAPDYEIETVIIPSIYNGLPITKINAVPLKGEFASVKNVFVPETVIDISSAAFVGSGDIVASLEYIGVAPNNDMYKSVDGVLYSKDGTELIRYPSGKKDTSYTILDGVISINKMCFQNCSNLKSVSIPNTVTEIGFNTFFNCKSLESISIPDSVTKMDYGIFEGCESLKNVSLSNNTYAIRFGTFYGCTSLESITIPSNVKSVEIFAFKGCISLKTLVISEGLTTINSQAFQGCTSLDTVVIPKSVTTIKRLAFLDCMNVTVCCEVNIKPDGWEDEWDAEVKNVIWGYKGE